MDGRRLRLREDGMDALRIVLERRSLDVIVLDLTAAVVFATNGPALAARASPVTWERRRGKLLGAARC